MRQSMMASAITEQSQLLVSWQALTMSCAAMQQDAYQWIQLESATGEQQCRDEWQVQPVAVADANDTRGFSRTAAAQHWVQQGT